MASGVRRPGATRRPGGTGRKPRGSGRGANAMLAVYTTVGNLEQARALAGELVRRRLVACAQICPIESFYRWRGAVHNEPELRLLLKTTAARYPALQAAVRGLHPYELPAMYAVRVARGSEPYARWVAESCAVERRSR